MSVVKWLKRVLRGNPAASSIPMNSGNRVSSPPLAGPMVNGPASIKVDDDFREVMSFLSHGTPFSTEKLLERVSKLQKGNASWPEIWTSINPDNDPQVLRLLVELRGPHMFTPHIALNVLEDGCRRAARISRSPDRLAALKAALNCSKRFTDHD